MKLLATLGLVIICLFSCTTPEKKDAFTSSLDSLFSNSFPANEPGGAILIMKGDHIVFSQGYGIADLATQSKINSQTLFNLGSISKTFVANAILILQSQGKLSVEDSMEKYFSDFKNKQIAQKVKI
jgi:CubicO group peptidase (beta-lactamase class C family)